MVVCGVHLEQWKEEVAMAASEALVASCMEVQGKWWHQWGKGRGVCVGVGNVCWSSLSEDWGVMG